MTGEPWVRWPPAGEVEAHEGVAGLHEGHEDGLVGLAAGIGLDIGEAAFEQAAGPLDGEILGDVDELAAAVIAPARIPFRVFVGHHRALRLEHGTRDDVLGGDELDLVALAAEFEVDGAGDVRIGVGESGRKEAVRHMRLRRLDRAHLILVDGLGKPRCASAWLAPAPGL